MPAQLARVIDGCLERAAAATWDELGENTREATRRLVMDSIGAAAAGRLAPGVQAALETLIDVSGTGKVRVPWIGAALPVADAAMALSWLIHAWDYDDTNDAAVLHCASVAVASAYAAAAALDERGERFFEGVVAGIEVMSRLSLALGYQRGVIRTSGLAGIGAAAAAARVLGLKTSQLRSAVALATPFAMAPTSRQVLVDSGETKRLQPGMGVREGILCAFLARSGLQGPPGWFSGEFGLGALVGEQSTTLQLALREGWEIDRLSLKPYPSCRFTHASVAAAFQLAKHSLDPATVRTIRVHVPAAITHATVSRPWARRGTPLNDSQFSIPWMVAATLLLGRADLDVLAGPSLLDPAIEKLASRISVVQDQEADSSGLTPVKMILRDVNGAERACEVRDAPGSAGDPIGWTQITRKAAGCLRAAGLPAEWAERLRESVAALEALPVRDLLQFAGTPAAAKLA